MVDVPSVTPVTVTDAPVPVIVTFELFADHVKLLASNPSDNVAVNVSEYVVDINLAVLELLFVIASVMFPFSVIGSELPSPPVILHV